MINSVVLMIASSDVVGVFNPDQAEMEHNNAFSI